MNLYKKVFINQHGMLEGELFDKKNFMLTEYFSDELYLSYDFVEIEKAFYDVDESNKEQWNATGNAVAIIITKDNICFSHLILDDIPDLNLSHEDFIDSFYYWKEKYMEYIGCKQLKNLNLNYINKIFSTQRNHFWFEFQPGLHFLEFFLENEMRDKKYSDKIFKIYNDSLKYYKDEKVYLNIKNYKLIFYKNQLSLTNDELGIKSIQFETDKIMEDLNAYLELSQKYK